MKKINWEHLLLLVIDFILVGYIVATLTRLAIGEFIGIEGLMGMFITGIFAEPITEELVRILCK